ncbi:MAG TPA: hypothetical protein PLH75_12780, partial [Amaricoccus sp.]|nr:hypothetical protein [Amaricoccus sp.]
MRSPGTYPPAPAEELFFAAGFFFAAALFAGARFFAAARFAGFLAAISATACSSVTSSGVMP